MGTLTSYVGALFVDRPLTKGSTGFCWINIMYVTHSRQGKVLLAPTVRWLETGLRRHILFLLICCQCLCLSLWSVSDKSMRSSQIRDQFVAGSAQITDHRDWWTARTRHRRPQAKLSFRSKTKAGPLEAEQLLSREGNIALVR